MELLAIVLIFIMAVGYFLPSIIAFKRKHKFRWVIFVINIFGVLCATWIFALAWSVWPKDEFLN